MTSSLPLKQFLIIVLSILSFSLFGQRQVTGTVTDSQTGAPLIGANVQIVGTSNRTLTDLDGNYNLVIREGTVVLEFSYNGYQTQQIDITGKFRVNAEMTAEVTSRIVSGTVTDIETNEPLIGASVLIVGTSSGAITDFNGNFKLEIPEGFDELQISYQGYYQQQIDLMGQRSVMIEMTAEVTSRIVSGTVTDIETNEPLIGASVLIVGTSSGAITDFNGNFKLEIPKGFDELQISYQGYYQQQIDLMGQRSVMIEMTAEVTSRVVSGTVVDIETKEPLIGANVLIVGTSSGTVTDLDGNFNLEIPKGFDILEISYNGYQNRQQNITAIDRVIIRMTPEQTREEANRAVLEKALDLGQNKSNQDAIEYLDGLLTTAQNKNDSAFLNLNLGYFHSRNNASTYDGYRSNLRKAANYYQSGLNVDSNNTQARFNLYHVYSKLGQFEEAATAIKNLETKSRFEGTYHALLGDIERMQNPKNTAKARALYTHSIHSKYPSISGPRKIVQLHSISDDDDSLLFSQCQEFLTLGYTAEAKEGCELIMKRCQSTQLFKKAMFQWIAISLRQSNFDAKKLTELIEVLKVNKCSVENISAVKELLSLEKDLTYQPNEQSWWRSSPRKHYYWLAAQKLITDYSIELQKSDLLSIRPLYTTILDSLINAELPDYSAEIFGSPYTLEVKTYEALMNSLKYANKKSQSGVGETTIFLYNLRGRLILRIEQMKKQSRDEAIAASLATEELSKQFGLYVVKNQPEFYRTADTIRLFQISNYNTYPDADFHSAYGNILLEFGDRTRATKQYLKAVQAFMETDQLTQALAYLEASNKTDNSILLNQIVNARMAIKSLNGEEIKNIYEVENFKWLKEKTTLVSEEFLIRQQFKTLFDIGRRAEQLGHLDMKNEKFVEAIKKIASLSVINLSDVYRLNYVDYTRPLHATMPGTEMIHPEAGKILDIPYIRIATPFFELARAVPLKTFEEWKSDFIK